MEVDNVLQFERCSAIGSNQTTIFVSSLDIKPHPKKYWLTMANFKDSSAFETQDKFALNILNL
jgi:hypothetical protein